MKIISIETSCDETAAAVIEDGRKICSSVIHTQVEEHKLYGGVVPEIASRRHIEAICGVTAEALEQAGLTVREADAIAVTAAPGLIGAVLVPRPRPTVLACRSCRSTISAAMWRPIIWPTPIWSRPFWRSSSAGDTATSCW